VAKDVEGVGFTSASLEALILGTELGGLLLFERIESEMALVAEIAPCAYLDHGMETVRFNIPFLIDIGG